MIRYIVSEARRPGSNLRLTFINATFWAKIRHITRANDFRVFYVIKFSVRHKVLKRRSFIFFMWVWMINIIATKKRNCFKVDLMCGFRVGIRISYWRSVGLYKIALEFCNEVIQDSKTLEIIKFTHAVMYIIHKTSHYSTWDSIQSYTDFLSLMDRFKNVF